MKSYVVINGIVEGSKVSDPGASGGSAWHHGNGSPSGLLGENEDYYIETNAGRFYKKYGTRWINFMHVELVGSVIDAGEF